MSNIEDYLKWRGDLSFAASPICEVDIAIFSQLVFLHPEKVLHNKNKLSIEKYGELFYKKQYDKLGIGVMEPQDINGLLSLCAKSERYKKCVIHGLFSKYSEKNQMQITAISIDIEEIDTRVIIFCGTGDTIIGWRENFNLIYKTPTPSQQLSVSYLDSMGKDYSGNIIVCGHSKGGHLAIYSALNCPTSVQEKIVAVYNLDGPGITDKLSQTRDFEQIHDKITSIIPEGSIIGRLFEHSERLKIVCSNDIGLYQHDCFNWKVLGTEFVTAEKFSDESNGVHTLVNNILQTMSDEDRAQFVEALYEMLFQTNAKTLTDLLNKRRELITSYTNLNSEARNALTSIGIKLLKDKYVRKLLLANVAKYAKIK